VKQRGTWWLVLGLLAAVGCQSAEWGVADFPTDWPTAQVVWPSTDRPAPATRPAPALPEEPAVADCLRAAALNNPGLEARWRQWQAALERVPQAGALPDPMLRYAFYIEEVETRVGPQQHGLGLSQTFPWFGKLDAKADAATQAAHAAYARYEQAKLALFQQVRDGYYEYAYLAQAIRITRENRDLVAALERVARAKYRVGRAGHPDVIRAQVELGKIQNDLASLTDRRGALAARLNALMNRPIGAPIGWPKGIPEAGPLDEGELLTALADANPELRALQYEVARRGKALASAKLAYFPDVTVGLDWIQTGDAVFPTPDSGQDPVILRFGINLPLWRGKLDAGVREAKNRLVAASRAHEDRRNLLAGQVRLTLYRYDDARRQVALYRDTLIPKARQGLKASETGYRAGTVDFLALLDVQQQLLAFELARQRGLATARQRLAELERLVGRRLTLP